MNDIKVPEFLYNRLKLQYKENDIGRIINGYSKKRKTTFRVNRLKSTAQEIEAILNENNILFERIKWYEDAFILNDANENNLRSLSIYEDGKIYLQSLSSMLPAIFVEPKANENILDMCAAPGGKTTQLAALSNNSSLITACEKNKIRAERLRYNIEKQCANKITILNEDSRKLSNYFSFDKILLDSPCSGSGTIFIEDEKLEKYFNEELISRSIKTQQVLLNKAVELLKPGHEMVYSTCSILKEENENNVLKLLKMSKVELIQIDDKQLEELPLLTSTIEGTITVCPTELYEGFFMAKLRKKV